MKHPEIIRIQQRLLKSHATYCQAAWNSVSEREDHFRSAETIYNEMRELFPAEKGLLEDLRILPGQV